MRPPDEKQAVPRIAELLAELFGSSLPSVCVQHVGRQERFDFAVSVAGHRFAGEYKRNASAGSIAAAIESLQRCAKTSDDVSIPLVVVPFMGQVGRDLCEQRRISWLDLCGNAKIVAPGHRIWIEGRPNRFVQRGRPANVFASKSSRIARQLLLYPRRFQSQAELRSHTGLADGYISKIARRLVEEGYLDVNGAGAVRPRDPNLLLDAWHETYDFSRHRIIKGHVSARSGDELLERVVEQIARERLDWAVTGLSAAWLYTRFAAFRLATVYLSSMPSHSFLKRLEFTEEPKGANLWLVLPDDEGVFHGTRAQQGIPTVSAVQTYLDLKGHPERAKDAAAELRRKLLDWGPHGT